MSERKSVDNYILPLASVHPLDRLSSPNPSWHRLNQERSAKPLRSHMISQLAVNKVHDDLDQQKFQSQKVTNLESGQ